MAQLLTCMDDLAAGKKGGGGGGGSGAAGAGVDPSTADAADPSTPPDRHVVVIAATNRPDALDAALRRAGRFDREIALSIPGEAARAAILAVVTRGLRLDGAVDVVALAAATPGYVGADLEALAKEAAAVAATRVFAALEASTAPPVVAGDATTIRPTPRLGAGPLNPAELAGLAITPSDFAAALLRVQPSVRREGFTTAPAVTWADVGALADVREELQFCITRPIRDPAPYAALGLAAPAGVLLYGPPGCGKTLLARAVAAESGANFVSVKGPELLTKYVGESEAAVRRVFARASAAAPCVLFFDELDALAPRRGGGGGDGGAAERVVNALLTELDGLVARGAVYVVAATNRPDMVDPALLRPGRLDKALFVPLPAPAARAEIVRTLVRRVPLAPDADPAAIAASPACDGFSGADLAALVREAAVAALKEATAAAGGGATASAPCVSARHFASALLAVPPSVSPRDARMYGQLRSRLSGGREARAAPGSARAGAAADDAALPPAAAEP